MGTRTRWKISHSNLIERRDLVIDAGRRTVTFTESTAFASSRVFPFRQIECILLSANFELSFQVGMEVFRIQTYPNNRYQQEAIAALLAGVSAIARAPLPQAAEGAMPAPPSST